MRILQIWKLSSLSFAGALDMWAHKKKVTKICSASPTQFFRSYLQTHGDFLIFVLF